MMRSGQLPQSPTHLSGLRKCLPGRCASLLTRCFTFRKASRLFHARLSQFLSKASFSNFDPPRGQSIEWWLPECGRDLLPAEPGRFLSTCLSWWDHCHHLPPYISPPLICSLLIFLICSYCPAPPSCAFASEFFSDFPNLHRHAFTPTLTASYHSRVLKNIKLIYCQR